MRWSVGQCPGPRTGGVPLKRIERVHHGLRKGLVSRGKMQDIFLSCNLACKAKLSSGVNQHFIQKAALPVLLKVPNDISKRSNHNRCLCNILIVFVIYQVLEFF